MLEVTDLHVYYGQIHALKGISFRVGQGEIVTLLGNNGAGKTTTLRTLSGLLAPRQGDVRFEGASLLGIAAHDVVLKGITHVPEGRRIFNRLSVVENLEMGAYTRSDRAARLLGWQARLSIAEGIRHSLRWAGIRDDILPE